MYNYKASSGTPTGPDDILTFGKHKGERVRDLSDGYISWFITAKRKEIDFWSGELVRREAERKEKERQRQEERKRQEEDSRNWKQNTYSGSGFGNAGRGASPTMEEIIQAGYREMAKKYHPDHGGDTKKMQDVNAAYENLKNVVRH